MNDFEKKQMFELFLQSAIRACSRDGDNIKISESSYYEIDEQIKQLKNKVNKEALQSILSNIKRGKLRNSQLQDLKKRFEKKYYTLTGIPVTSYIENNNGVELPQIKNGDELRNIYCFEYLRYLANQIPEKLKEGNSPIYRNVFSIVTEKYRPTYPYGNYFTQFLTTLEQLIVSGQYNNYRDAEKNESQKKLYDELIYRIFNNRNLAVERASDFIKPILQSNIKQTSSEFVPAVRERMIVGSSNSTIQKIRNFLNFFFRNNLNDTTPQHVGSLPNEITAVLGPEFKPQFTTSLSLIREYEYKDDQDPTEIRYGTQGQIENDDARNSPIYDEYLAVLRRRGNLHIYFNNLPTDRTDIHDPAGRREVKLTKKLHELEENHPKSFVIITMPADKGLLDRKHVKNTEKPITYQVAFDTMLSIADGTSKSKIKDFEISKDVKKLLYLPKDLIIQDENQLEKILKANENKILEKLLTKSFETLGFKGGQNLSPADRHAVFFHFIKFELTNHIITTLQPNSFNMACKDAIDRGGVHSAYYNLLKSIERGKPLSQDEFNRALHGPPTMVKGRGMNSHTKNIWNAIDAYIRQNDLNLKNKPAIPEWLRQWHKKNAIRELPITLESYQEIIKKEIDNPFCFFYSRQIKEKKQQLAKKLSTQITKDYTLPTLTKDERKLLEGRLGKAVQDLEQKKLISISR